MAMVDNAHQAHILRMCLIHPMSLFMHTVTQEWMQQPQKGTIPTARFRHSASVVDGTELVLFGGIGTATKELNDVRAFDIGR